MPDVSLSVVIRSREDIIYQTEAAAVSSANERGKFDILPYHAHFISLIQEKVIIHEKNGEQREFEIGTGLMHVEENRVSIYLEPQTPP